MCQVLSVSTSGYYDSRKRPKSARALADEELLVLIREVFDEHRGRYGALRIWKELQDRDLDVGRDRIARLMKDAGLRGKTRTRRRPKTTIRDDEARASDNLLARNFTVDTSNTAWLADITYIATKEGWLYLSAVIDLFSRKVVGWSMRESLHRDGALDALRMALLNRKPAENAIHHSDRGCQYTSLDYQEALKDAGLRSSMSAVGQCWDNAPMESFFATMKRELDVEVFASKAAARQAIFKYIECYYNTKRRHSSNNYLSPHQFELQHEQRSAA